MTSMPAAAAIIGAAPTRRRLLFVVGAAVLLVDVGTKSLAVGLLEPGHAVSLVGDRLVCVLTRNAGAALSIAAGNAVLLSVAVLITVVAVGALGWRVRSAGWALGLGMVLGAPPVTWSIECSGHRVRCAGRWWISSPSAGGQCSTSPTSPYSAG